MRSVCQVCREEKPDVNWNQYPQGGTGPRPILKQALTCGKCHNDFLKWIDREWPSMEVVEVSPAD